MGVWLAVVIVVMVLALGAGGAWVAERRRSSRSTNVLKEEEGPMDDPR